MNKKKIGLWLAAILCTAATGSIVYAQVVPQGPSLAEVQERAGQAFDRMDVNLDGQIDAADRGEASAALMRTRFDSADSNSDGSLAFEEFAAAREAMRGDWADRRDDRRGGRHDRGRHEEFGRGGFGLMGGAGPAADSNGDGAITQAEFNAAITGHFNRADANNDGVMTREEGQAARQAMRTAAQARRSVAAPPAPVN